MTKGDITKITRIRMKVKEGNVYFMVGDGFLDVTIPYENREENLKDRIAFDNICKAVSLLMNGN